MVNNTKSFLLEPLHSKMPIVDSEGNPTPYFQHIMQLVQLGVTLEKGPGGEINVADGEITLEMLQEIQAKTVLGLNDTVNGPVEEVTASQLLDWLGTAAQGDIIYRNATGWVFLHAGSAGQILSTNGAGANPSWISNSAADPDGNATLTKPLAASFTLENAGTATMANGTNGLVLTAPSSTANARFMRYTAGLPGASWTLTIRGRVIGPPNGAVHARCIMMRNSTSGRLVTLGDGSTTNIIVERWSSYTAANAAALSFSTYHAEIPWRRVSSNGTVLTFDVSCDGREWSSLGTETIATYLTATGGTLDQVGIGLFFGAASTVSQKNIFQSFTLV